MKRIFLSTVVCALCFSMCFSMSACDPSTFNYQYSDLKDNVVSIELINYNASEVKSFRSWMPNHYSELLSFDLKKMELIETLETEKFDDFLTQLSEIDFLYEYYAYNSPKDICIRLVYANGDFEILSCDYKHNSFGGYVGKYNKNGEVIDFRGCFTSLPDFEYLVHNFFEASLS